MVMTGVCEFAGLSLALALLISSPGFIASCTSFRPATLFPFRQWPSLRVDLSRQFDGAGLRAARPPLLYGLRLGTYLLRRELSPQFAKELADVHSRAEKVPRSVRPFIWISVSVLYVLMFSPAACIVQALFASNFPWAGFSQAWQ